MELNADTEIIKTNDEENDDNESLSFVQNEELSTPHGENLYQIKRELFKQKNLLLNNTCALDKRIHNVRNKDIKQNKKAMLENYEYVKQSKLLREDYDELKKTVKKLKFA